MQLREENNFFQSDIWLSVISNGLGAELFNHPMDQQGTYKLPIFCKGPFCILYPGFPIGDVPSSYLTFLLEANNMKASAERRWQLLRLWQSSLLEPWQTDKKPSSWIPETLISDLASWCEKSLASSIRRNIKKAYKSNLRIETATEKDAGCLFDLYQKMIIKKRGEIRYTKAYFNELVKQGRASSGLQVNVARTANGVLASMLVCAYHKENAFYLHGATNEKYSYMRPADMLMFEAIRSARQSGLKAFSFLPSPANQPGLIRFKEKWGGITLMTPVFDCYQRSIGGGTLKLALRARRFFLK